MSQVCLQFYSFDQFIMRMRDELKAMGKVHSSVQEMLAEARQIVSPPFPASRSQASHMEVYLPATKINQHLKEILRGPSGNYKRIERSKRYSSVTLQNYTQKQDKGHSNLISRIKNPSSKLAGRSLNRYALDSIISNVQDQLLDKRNKRLLCEKKTINLLPELPNMPKSQAKDAKRIESYYQKIEEWAPRYYLTITQKNSIDSPSETLDNSRQNSPSTQKKQTFKEKQRNKRVKSQLLKKLEEKASQILRQQKQAKQRKAQKIEPKKEETYDPQPWILQSRKEEYFDFNNF